MRRKFRVSVFDSKPTGGVTIPLMHACHAMRKRPELWSRAAAYSRDWYRKIGGAAIGELQNEFGAYFTIRVRPYLRLIKRELQHKGIEFIKTATDASALKGYAAIFIATGSQTTQLAAIRILPGWESYFSRVGAAALNDETKTSNYINVPPRAGYIHQNKETRASAAALARAMHATGRHALFYGERLTTRDRMPVVGFLGEQDSPFMFCGMGYHAMTYAPYLAHAVAAQLAGETPVDENLVCALTPARFHPRT